MIHIHEAGGSSPSNPTIFMNDPKEVLVGVVEKGGKYLIIKRSPSSHFDPNRWEFVSLMSGPGTTEKDVEEQIKKETGLRTSIVKQGTVFRIEDEYGKWHVKPFLFETSSSQVRLDKNHTDYKWINKSELNQLETVKGLEKNLSAFSLKQLSAALLLYRYGKKGLEILLVHPGGPYWAKKDAWGIPKGVYEDEDPLSAAKREFEEEIGRQAPEGKAIDLGEIKISGRKTIKAFAVKGDMDVRQITSNTFVMEWPPRSGREIEVPEVDKAAWLPVAQAMPKMHKGQGIFIQRLAEKIGFSLEPGDTSVQASLF
jgi:predicted NUDIX family NTP pyrophosphohydrolase